MKKTKFLSFCAAMLLALSLVMIPAYATETEAEETGEEAVEMVEEEAAAAEGEEAPKKSGSMMNIILVVGVVAVIGIAAAEIHRDNKKKVSHG